MSTAERLKRAAKALHTKAEKARNAEQSTSTPVRAFVRIVLANPEKAYHGRIGQVHSHNDLRDKAHPDIPVEIGVKFSAGRNAPVVWFDPSELTRDGVTKPRGWDVPAPANA